MVMLSSSLEAPIANFDQDDLSRYPLVRRLFSTLTSVPLDWSVRIGLYGPWGHGKTSVLLLLRDFARSKGYFVVEYTPWSSTTPAQSLTLLYLAIVDECERRGIQFPGKKKARILKYREKIQPLLERFSKTHAINEIAVPLISQLFDEVFQASEEWYKTLRKSVKDGRVLILIDDLDRASPELIPVLLLALREKLALPGFSFLLAFDNNIIVKTIQVQNPAWKPGDKFLEKIIDIPFILPPSNVSQRVKLIKRAIPEQASEAIDSVKELLPETPRQLKLLARHVFALSNEVERHYPRELNWVSILYFLMIRMESERFLQEFAADIEDLFYGWVAVINDKDKQKETISNTVKSICDRCAIKEEEKIQRLTALVDALQFSTELTQGSDLKYQATFADQPHAVTWKEYDSFFESWRPSKQLALISDWAQQHASAVGRHPGSVFQEIFEVTVYRREQRLNEAADDTFTIEQHAKFAEDAEPYGELLFQLLIDGNGVAEFEPIHTEEIFLRVLKSYERYFSFHRQKADRKLRAQEERLLRDFVKERVLPAQVLYKVLSHFIIRRGIGSPLRELSDSLASELEPELFDIGLEDFRRVGAWREGDSEYNRGVRSVLFRRAAEGEGARKALIAVLREAKKNGTVHTNSLYFTEYLIEAVQGKLSTEFEKLTKELLLDKEFVSEVWASVTCRPLQFRAGDSIAKIADALKKCTDASLDEPDWLVEWRDEAEKREESSPN